jgi:hypothetical protein
MAEIEGTGHALSQLFTTYAMLSENGFTQRKKQAIGQVMSRFRGDLKESYSFDIETEDGKVTEQSCLNAYTQALDYLMHNISDAQGQQIVKMLLDIGEVDGVNITGEGVNWNETLIELAMDGFGMLDE